ncbi:MAG: RagB/SusD family nutrient uptake outer membrane protein [Bacteroidales bacterium]|nr:RagB/SusD family nutrient uptake outer membrane protein [Bacteroidales bacterium]
MKRILGMAALAMGTLAFTACEDFLDQKSASEYSSENVYNSVYNTGLTINTLYGSLCQDRTYSQSMSIHAGTNTDIELIDGLGANGTVEGGANGERVWGNYNLTPSYYSAIGDIWTKLYEIVENANLSIEGIRNSDILTSGTSSQQKQMKAYLGEALTLRAMVYLDIIRLWGDVPMKFEPTLSDLSNAYLDKTDRDVILDQLMTDLDEAIGYLPYAGTDADYTTEHVTRGYAEALYAQVALTRAGYVIREKAKDGYVTASSEATYSYLGKTSDDVYPTQRPADADRKALYEKALVKLQSVINSGYHKLNPSYENEWYLINQLQLDNTYRENLFEIPMGVGVNSELGYTIGIRLNGTTSAFGYSNSSGKVKVTAPYFYSFRHENDFVDTRRDVTCGNYQIKDETRNGASVTFDSPLNSNAPFGIYVAKYNPRWMSEQWLAVNLAAASKVFTGINCVKMRYSQVLLMYAEVLNELYGPTAEAVDALTQVHCRAFSDAAQTQEQAYIQSQATDKDTFFAAIVQENAWELGGECARKWDLIRWNLLTDKINQMKTDYKNAIDNGDWPGTVYYKYADDGNTILDLSSFTWYGTPASTAGYYGSAKGYGDMNDTQYNTNLNALSGGLVNSPAVKNRYLIPLYTTTISSSNGVLSNSYGW